VSAIAASLPIASLPPIHSPPLPSLLSPPSLLCLSPFSLNPPARCGAALRGCHGPFECRWEPDLQSLLNISRLFDVALSTIFWKLGELGCLFVVVLFFQRNCNILFRSESWELYRQTPCREFWPPQRKLVKACAAPRPVAIPPPRASVSLSSLRFPSSCSTSHAPPPPLISLGYLCVRMLGNGVVGLDSV
jgi:hypothetical protein